MDEEQIISDLDDCLLSNQDLKNEKWKNGYESAKIS